MKTIILTTLMTIATSTAFAAKECGGRDALRTLSAAADQISAKVENDTRVEIDRTSANYSQLNAIGVVQPADQKSYGTGFMVDACHVITNSHVAFDSHVTGAIGSKTFFSVGQTGSKNNPFKYSKIEGKIIAKGDYNHTVSTVNADWVIIRLSKSIKDVPSIPIYQMDSAALKGKNVTTVGFPGDLSQNGNDLSKAHGDTNCNLDGMSVYGFQYHTCIATSGQSGSPVMAKGNDGKYYALGMISGDANFQVKSTKEKEDRKMAVSFTSGKKVNVSSDGDKILTAIAADAPCN